ncbi:hypothetical protein Pdw03_0267 [Penicillium digitatum]|uniref:Uncharacterized protein n=3 Tax=Penicillium digitatum TaxID=36651 RepID=K9FSZ1_PEND2|nr:hypothetical protein PDIP_17630 [Penicillium digitatum Pd1]EKV12244.1 hypothetical protein PDIG_45690 [Penicillium digitatum PHI26]EKV20331.1 hypothetical protein PDIP_17630 [Penicillium digitatum Pd1]QQK45369.1 hypothetical protein Pdw03_0267 [Penicillium digitatum]
MERIKKTVLRIKAGVPATRERIRGRILTMRKLNKATASKVLASEIMTEEVLVSEVLVEDVIEETPYASNQVVNSTSEVPASEAPDLPASAIPRASDQVVDAVRTSKKTSHAYSDTPLFYICKLAEDTFKDMLWLQFGKKWESFEIRFLADIAKYPPDVMVDRNSPCPLEWLPVEVRATIWKYVFDDGNEAIFVKKDGMTPKLPTSMRFVSFDWASEAWFGYITSLRNRTLVVMDFPQHGYLAPHFPIFQELSTVRIRAIKFALGDNDPEKAKERTRDFIRFMLKHKNCGFLALHTLIVELRSNWETEDFTEMTLAELLVCGAFVEIERIRIHGHVTDEKLNRLLERAREIAQVSF